MSVRVPESKCINCGKKVDAADHTMLTPPLPPSDGDIMICLYCSHIHIYDGNKMREPTENEMVEIAGNSDMLDAVAFAGAFQILFGKST
jgi:hypothetical protein